MASVLKVKKIKDALNKALKVGYTEGDMHIGGVRIVLCNLRPDEYVLIHDETKDKEDVEFLNMYREEHLCRSIVQLDDLSFRGVDFFEVEEEAEDGSTSLVKIERHEYIRDYIVKTWSLEAVNAVFKKFNDLVALSEKTSMEGVTLAVPDETNDEKYRRLLLEIKETEGQIPMDLASRLLAEQGYTKMVTGAELEVADRVLTQAKMERDREEAPPAPLPETRPQAAPQPQPQVRRAPQPPPAPVFKPEETSRESSFREASPEDLARLRNPLNKQAGVASVEGLTKSQRIAQEEGIDQSEIDALEGSVPVVLPTPKPDPSMLFDAPPTARLNPRFNPPKRLARVREGLPRRYQRDDRRSQ